MNERPTLATVELESLLQTQLLGQRLGALLSAGDTLALVGTLGAGKTTLAQSLLAAVGVDPQRVTSPTFALIQSYATRLGTAHHIDAYRVRDEDEFLELGIEELWEDESCVTLVEWADKWNDWMPPLSLWIQIEWCSASKRTISFRGDHDHWQQRIDQALG